MIGEDREDGGMAGQMDNGRLALGLLGGHVSPIRSGAIDPVAATEIAQEGGT